MKIEKIKKSWMIAHGHRIDAPFHLSDGVITMERIEKSPCETTTLSSATKQIFLGSIFRRTFVLNHNVGIPYITGSEMMKKDIDTGRFLSKKLTKNQESLMVKKNWILLTCSGTIGNVVFTNDEFEGKIGTHDLIRIIPSENKLRKGFLFAFLKSRFGYALLTQSEYGGVVKHIEPEQIKGLPIPVFSDKKQKEIDELIHESVNSRSVGNKLLKEAIEVLENIIGESSTHLGFQTGKANSKSLNSFHKRFDAQYQLGWKKLREEYLMKLEYRKISKLAKKISVGNRGKRYYVKNGTPFLSSSEMMLTNPLVQCKRISNKTPNLKALLTEEKDILISRSGTVGNTIIVSKGLSKTAVSEHALRLVVDADLISPNYVYCYLNTKFGLKSMEASAFGSVIITLSEELIGNIDIPIVDDNIIQTIDKLIDQYQELHDKANDIENQAINLIETEIDSWQN